MDPNNINNTNNTNNVDSTNSGAQMEQPAPEAANVQGDKPASKNRLWIILGCTVGGIAVVVLLVVLVMQFMGAGNSVVGNWACTRYLYNTSTLRDNPSVMMQLNSDGTYLFGEYNDLANNHFAGTYTAALSEKASSDGYTFYNLTFGPTQEYILDGRAQSVEGAQMDKMELGIINYGDHREASLIMTGSYSTYICKTE